MTLPEDSDLNKASLIQSPYCPLRGISPQGENGYTHFNRRIYQVIISKVNYPYIPKGKRIYSQIKWRNEGKKTTRNQVAHPRRRNLSFNQPIVFILLHR